MNNLTEHEQTIILHIHEHLGPFRDRLSRVEEKVDGHAGSISGLKKDISDLDRKVDSLEKKVDTNHLVTIQMINDTKDHLLNVFLEHDRKEESMYHSSKKDINALVEVVNKQSEHMEYHINEFVKIKWLIIGGAGVITTLVTIAFFLLDHLGPIFK